MARQPGDTQHSTNRRPDHFIIPGIPHSSSAAAGWSPIWFTLYQKCYGGDSRIRHRTFGLSERVTESQHQVQLKPPVTPSVQTGKKKDIKLTVPPCIETSSGMPLKPSHEPHKIHDRLGGPSGPLLMANAFCAGCALFLLRQKEFTTSKQELSSAMLNIILCIDSGRAHLHSSPSPTKGEDNHAKTANPKSSVGQRSL